jgi:hypothetical protein
MNRISAICPAVLMASAACAQEGRLSVGGDPASAWKGMAISFVTKIEPPGTQLPGEVIVGSGCAQHIINDREHKRAFSYDLVLQPSEDGKSARIRV